MFRLLLRHMSASIACLVVLLISPGYPAAAQNLPADSEVIVSTIPSLPGVVINFDDQTATTNSDGIATFLSTSNEGIADRIQVSTPEIEQPDILRAKYDRLYRIDNLHYALAFDIQRPVTFSFVGVNGERVDHDRIGATNLKNSLGGLTPEVPLDQPLWVYSERVVSIQGGAEVRAIEWSVESVMVRGVNVVNRAQIRFFPREQSHVEITVLFFSAKFAITDMFFGFPRGEIIELSFPDGEIVRHELDDNGELFLSSLPRGEYSVMIDGSGPRIARPLVLSRNQEVNLDMLTWLDIIVVGLIGLSFLIGPVVLGRWIRHSRAEKVDGRNLAIDVEQPEFRGNLPLEGRT